MTETGSSRLCRARPNKLLAIGNVIAATSAVNSDRERNTFESR